MSCRLFCGIELGFNNVIANVRRKINWKHFGRTIVGNTLPFAVRNQE